MPHTLDQILPSLQSLGLWSYWIIGAAALLEGFFVTGLFVPGMLVVVAGGILVEQGAIDPLDLAWFVAIGSILGGEASYASGMLVKRSFGGRRDPENSPQFQRAKRLFAHYGGLALVIGRFFGPLAGFVTLAAAISGMERRRFVFWNIASGIPYAVLVPLAGYFLGGILTRASPLATRIALFIGGVALVLAVMWWLVVRVKQMLPFVLSVLRSMGRAVAENDDVCAWAARHPRRADFIAHRFDATRFSGLVSTLLTVAIIYVFSIWVESAFSFLTAGPMMQADLRLANLIHAFWTPWLIRDFTYVTALGDWRVVTLVMLAMLVWLWARNRSDLMLGLTVSVIGNVTTVALLKLLFERPRPKLAYFVETSGSFPSGHAAISVALYAMLFFTMWKLRWLGPIKAALLAATLAFVVGLSRLYLIEHYLSDVINGWLVGALWMLIGIAIGEWWRSTGRRLALAAPTRAAVPTLTSVLLLAFAGWQVADYEKARNVVVVQQVADQTVTDIAALFVTGKAPVETESAFGSPLEPVNIIVLAPNAAAARDAMTQAGWTQALPPTFGALTQAAFAALRNTEDARAPVTPYFWKAQPNDSAFEKPTRARSLRKRHHVRFWRTHYVTPEGLRLFVAAASFDDGLDWQLLHHIDPNIDAERDQIVNDLTAVGIVARTEMLAISKPRLGQSVAGDPWFTDGKAAVLTLK